MQEGDVGRQVPGRHQDGRLQAGTGAAESRLQPGSQRQGGRKILDDWGGGGQLPVGKSISRQRRMRAFLARRERRSAFLSGVVRKPRPSWRTSCRRPRSSRRSAWRSWRSRWCSAASRSPSRNGRSGAPTRSWSPTSSGPPRPKPSRCCNLPKDTSEKRSRGIGVDKPQPPLCLA